MNKIYITRKIPEVGIKMLTDKGYEVDINPDDRILTKAELITTLKAKPYDAVLSLLTDTIDAEVFDAVPTVKIIANYAVGFNNIDVVEATKRGMCVTNTPGALTDTVAEHAVALLLSVALRIVEADAYLRAGKYKGWEPMGFLGIDLKGKTIGILGAGRIGYRVAEILHNGFNMKVLYYDMKASEFMDKNLEATFCANMEDVLRQADIVSIHVPMMDSTEHLMNEKTLAMMKPTAFLINTSRGGVIDEEALFTALQNKVIAGAALDVYEHEPEICHGLCELPNVVLTPHIASATVSTRDEMAVLAAQNIIDYFEEKTPANIVKI